MPVFTQVLSPGRNNVGLQSAIIAGQNTDEIELIANPNGMDLEPSCDYSGGNETNVNMKNNFFAKSEAEVKFVDASNENYRLAAGSPAINYGGDVSKFEIATDFYEDIRLKGAAYDAGATEF